jgi:DNA modification methylase
MGESTLMKNTVTLSRKEIMEINKILLGDCLQSLKTLPDNSVDCCVTSPPYYGLRDYGVDGQIGLEEIPEEYISKLTEVFEQVRRVLKPEGTLWLNIGDSYNGYKGNANSEYNDSEFVGGHGNHPTRKSGFGLECKGLKPKDLIGIPWMLAFSLRNAGWYLRQDIIWHKPNPMPESVTDRCTKSHEYIFLLSKSQRYYFDYEAIQEEANPEYVAKNIRFGGNKYRDNDDLLFQTYSGNVWKPQKKTRTQDNGYAKAGGHRDNSGGFGDYSKHGHTKNCQYDGQKPNSMHLRREAGLPDEVYFVRNKRDVWSVNLKPNKETHFATYPEMLIQPCILAGCPENGVVLDPFMGSGTTGIVARKLNRNYIGCEPNPEYKTVAERRIAEYGEGLFNQE